MSSFDVTMTVDNLQVLKSLKLLSDRQIQYVMVNATNDTAKAIQTEVRKNVRKRFRLKASRGEFILRNTAVIQFASVKKESYNARVYVKYRTGLLLSEFEFGGTRHQVAKYGAVPVPMEGGARPSRSADVPSDMRLRALGKKKSKAFVIKGVGIFQRRGKKAVMLYALPSQVVIKPRLGFEQTAQAVASISYRLFLTSETAKAIAHSFGKGPSVKQPTAKSEG